MTKVNQLDFAGTTAFCGHDTHLVSLRVNIHGTKLELKDFTMTPNAELLYKHLST